MNRPAPTSPASDDPTRFDLLVLGLVCALVLGFYAWRAGAAVSEFGHATPQGAYYNQLVDGFARGQLHLATPAPPELAQLPDPWDPEANIAFRKSMFAEGRLHDTSYFQGRLYLYFGVTPALLLFWPWHILTGGYLEHSTAVAIFCSIGFLIAAGMLLSIRRRYFPAVDVGVLAGGAVALGLANTIPVMLGRPDVWEVPLSCGYMLTLATLAALWRAWHEPRYAARWLALASLAFGLAVGSRPSLLLGAPVLLLPLLAHWKNARDPRPRGWLARALAAAIVPSLVIGAGLALYNYLRFESIFEFGQRYQLAGDRQDTARHFSAGYLWYNLRLYFFSVAPWSGRFPFVGDVPVPPPPDGHGAVDLPYGIFTNTPVAWFALAAPLAWRGLDRAAAGPLRGLALALVFLFAAGALTLGLFYGTCTRYQVEFHAPLALLSCLGVFGLLGGPWAAGWRQPVLMALWLGLLGFSTAFSVLKTHQGTTHRLIAQGRALSHAGDDARAIELYARAVRLDPDNRDARLALALEYERTGRLPEAMAAYEQVLQQAPAHAAVRNNYGQLLSYAGRLEEAISQFEQALRAQPALMPAHFNLGVALQKAGRHEQALAPFARALELHPGFAEAHYQLCLSLRALGRLGEARRHYDDARRLKPGLPELRF